MTAPSLRSYLASLRRFWFIPVLSVLLTLGAFTILPEGEPESVTIGEILFTIESGDPGQDAEGGARLQEGDLAARRLSAYGGVVAGGESFRGVIADSAVAIAEPTMLNGITRQDDRLVIDADAAGRMTIRFENQDLPPAESLALVKELQAILALDVPVLDRQQVQPSIVDSPVVVAPRQGLVEPPSDPSMLGNVALPMMVGLFLGFGLIYLLDWRYRRVEDRRDLEERLGVDVLGESAGRAGDFQVLALALRRGPATTGIALFAAAPGKADLAPVVEGIVEASQQLSRAQRFPVVAGESTSEPITDQNALDEGEASPAIQLIDLTSPRGVHSDLVARAPSADAVAIFVEYGRTPMSDLVSMLIRLSDVSDTRLQVVGVKA